jgi:hypothetical protein
MTEELGAAVAGDIPSKTDSRGDHVSKTEVERAVGIDPDTRPLGLVGIEADAQIEREVGCRPPAVQEKEGQLIRLAGEILIPVPESVIGVVELESTTTHAVGVYNAAEGIHQRAGVRAGQMELISKDDVAHLGTRLELM